MKTLSLDVLNYFLNINDNENNNNKIVSIEDMVDFLFIMQYLFIKKYNRMLFTDPVFLVKSKKRSLIRLPEISKEYPHYSKSTFQCQIEIPKNLKKYIFYILCTSQIDFLYRFIANVHFLKEFLENYRFK